MRNRIADEVLDEFGVLDADGKMQQFQIRRETLDAPTQAVERFCSEREFSPLQASCILA